MSEAKFYGTPEMFRALRFTKETTEEEVRDFCPKANIGRSVHGPEWVAVPTPGGFHQLSYGNYIVARPDDDLFEVIPSRVFEALFMED